MSKKANQDIRQLRAIGHKLKPVVTVAGNGVTDNIVAELDRALNACMGVGFLLVSRLIGRWDEKNKTNGFD